MDLSYSEESSWHGSSEGSEFPEIDEQEEVDLFPLSLHPYDGLLLSPRAGQVFDDAVLEDSEGEPEFPRSPPAAQVYGNGGQADLEGEPDSQDEGPTELDDGNGHCDVNLTV